MIFNLKRPAFGRSSWSFVPASGAAQPEWAAEGLDWMMALPCSGTLTLTMSVFHADICLVAAGKPGTSDGTRVGGNGGGMITATDITLPAGVYTVTVGVSGSDTVLTAPDGRSWTARSGEGAAGGTYGTPKGGDGQLAWNDADTLLRTGWRYGPGGGYGFHRNAYSQDTPGGEGGDIGTAPADENAGAGASGLAHPAGYPGCPGTGQGGGGGSRIYNGSSFDDGDGGLGGSGAVLIRYHKEVSA